MSHGPVRRRWRLLTAVVVGNALIQAVTVLPGAVPGFTVLFVTLFLLSLLALVVGLALIAAAVVVPGSGRVVPLPSGRQWVASALAPLLVAAAGLLGPFVVPVAVLPATVLLAGAGAGPATSGRRALRPGHVAAVVLSALATVVIAAAGWVLALLAGFFVTGFWAASVTWLCVGAAGVGVLRWWSVLLGVRSSVRT